MIRAEGVRVVRSLFQETGDGSTPTSALQLTLEVIDFLDAKRLNRLWHSRLPRMGTGFVKDMPFLCFGAVFDGLYYAAAIWSNPVARNLPQQTWLELRRLAIAPDAPKNTASRMLGVMAKLIRKARPEVCRLVSYHDTEVHTGGIYKAAGWTPTTVNASGVWDRPGRSRPKAQSDAPKQRWEKALYERREEDRSPGDGAAEPARAEADVHVPGRPEGGVRERHALPRPSLWDTQVEDF